MSPKFGTSGLRGLVTALTPERVSAYVAAFVTACPMGQGLFIAHDLRASSPDLAQMVARAAQDMGVPVTLCGAIPTPALALAATQAGAAAVMITGSHIPADRNGLKFYTPTGEITKADEAAILQALGQATPHRIAGSQHQNTTAGPAYTARYQRAYREALQGLKLGFYAQSAVGRDLMPGLLRDLGAAVTPLGRADTFIPVDTEAVSAETRAMLHDWAASGDYDAILSTDADGDRPLLTDATGTVIPGDVLGQITGAALGAKVAVTPVSSNTGAEAVFDTVIRTRIGSPFVIAAMTAPQAIGYEANGGFLLGFDASGPAGPLPALMTRDAVLPLLAVLAEAAKAGGLAPLLARQPHRFTASDRLQGVATATSQALVQDMIGNPQNRAAFLAELDLSEDHTDTTDGLRIQATNGAIIHLRPSGNAPELRCYTESDSPTAAADLLQRGLAALDKRT